VMRWPLVLPCNSSQFLVGANDMTGSSASQDSADDDAAPLLTIATILLRRSRLLAGLGCLGMVLGLVSGLATPREYVATATFLPQDAEGSAAPLSGLAIAASQMGLRVAAGGKWNAAWYLRLLSSRALLEPIAQETVVVEELGRRRVAVGDLLGVLGGLPQVISGREDREIGAVQLRVSTRWPSVSLAVAESLLSGVNQFTLQWRQSQVGMERQFIEGRGSEAESALRVAEDSLGEFLRHNRAIDESPELQFIRGRLERSVALRQQLYAALLQSREEARIREVRDLPVITLLERPQIPLQPEARGTLRRGILGAVSALVFGMLALVFSAVTREALQGRSRAAREAAQALAEFRSQLPRLSRRR